MGRLKKGSHLVHVLAEYGEPGKICPVCGDYLTYESFAKNRSDKHLGLQAYCRVCHATKRDWSAINKRKKAKQPLYGFHRAKGREIVKRFLAGEDAGNIVTMEDDEILRKFLDEDIIRIKE